MTPSAGSVLVCVCGGIAAYKVCPVVSRLVQQDIPVVVAMTPEAQRFVGAVTFEALSGKPVHTDLWNPPDTHDPQHINLMRQSALILVAPATANMLAKMAQGIADDLISTLLLAAAPRSIIAAPAMNEGMWTHPATQANVALLRQRGVEMIGPESGWQACRSVGMGRMSEPDTILQTVLRRLHEQAI